MRKRIVRAVLIFVLVAALTVSAALPVTAAGHPFTDVSGTAYYAKAVEWAYTNGVVAGVSKTAFAPGAYMNRAMMVTMLYNAEGRPAVSGGKNFSDVPAGAYYEMPVRWASASGVAAGYDNGKFGAADRIKRQDIVMILWRYAGSPEPGDTEPFADNSSISKYAVDAVNWAKAHGIVSGKGSNRFDPQGSATRAEVVTILYNYLTSTHVYSPEVTRETTCTKAGERTYICTCGASYTESIPVKDHDWKSETIHHDAVIGTREVTQTWIHGYKVVSLILSDEGIGAGMDNRESFAEKWPEAWDLIWGSRLAQGIVPAPTHEVMASEYWMKEGDSSTLEYVYEYDIDNDPDGCDVYKFSDGDDDPVHKILEGHTLGNNTQGWTSYNYSNPETKETRTITEEYVITPAYDEVVTICTVCGAHK